MDEFDLPFRASLTPLTRRDLRLGYVRVFQGIYVRKSVTVDARVKAFAAAEFGGSNAVVYGISAAAIHRSKWIPDGAPAEIVLSRGESTLRGIWVHEDRLLPAEVCGRGDLRLTSPARTAFDLGRRRPFARAVERVDALLRATNCPLAQVGDVALHHAGARGIVQLRRVLEVADGGAESPKETQTRLLLIDAGLPRPMTQVVINDEWGRFVARVDLAYVRWKVIVEYDGEQHWTDPTQRSRDIDRRAELERLGWKTIHVSARLLRQQPQLVVQRVRTALSERGYRSAASAMVSLEPGVLSAVTRLSSRGRCNTPD